MKKIIILIMLAVILIPVTSALADETSPFLTGIWMSDDHNSKHRIVNPTMDYFIVEIAYFDEWGDFCGCNGEELYPNGYVQFDTDDQELYCEGDKGQVKVIAYKPCEGCNKIRWGDAEIAGFNQVDTWQGRVEFGMKGVTLNKTTKADMQYIHETCMGWYSEAAR